MKAGKSACKYSLHQVVPEVSGTPLVRLSVYWILLHPWASLVAQMEKNPPGMQETRVRSLGREDALEEGMATRSSILAWKIPWTEEPGGLQSREVQRLRHN